MRWLAGFDIDKPTLPLFNPDSRYVHDTKGLGLVLLPVLR